MIFLGCIICGKYGLNEFPLIDVNGKNPTKEMINIHTLCIVAKEINKKNYLSWPGNKISPHAKIETIPQENYETIRDFRIRKRSIIRLTDCEPRSRECKTNSSN